MSREKPDFVVLSLNVPLHLALAANDSPEAAQLLKDTVVSEMWRMLDAKLAHLPEMLEQYMAEDAPPEGAPV